MSLVMGKVSRPALGSITQASKTCHVILTGRCIIEEIQIPHSFPEYFIPHLLVLFVGQNGSTDNECPVPFVSKPRRRLYMILRFFSGDQYSTATAVMFLA
jgi:hypothetical protein